MGWVSFLEDIEKRLDEAMARPSPSLDRRRGSIGVESLRATNHILRTTNEELLRLLYAVKMDISSKKKQPDFCKEECVKLRDTNDRLRRSLADFGNSEASANPSLKDKDAAPHHPEKAELAWRSVKEAKQRASNAAKVVDALKEELKRAEKVRAEAQNEYQRLLQSERNSTKYVHRTGQDPGK